MTYTESPPFEQLALGDALPGLQLRDRWNASFDNWEADIADVVAHLTSANATIAGHVAEPSDPVTTLMFFELDQAGHSVQRALLALDEFSHLAEVRAGRPRPSEFLDMSRLGDDEPEPVAGRCEAESGWLPEQWT
jgi:hypothetical protein